MLPFSILMALTFWSSMAFPDSGSDPVFTHALESFKQSDLVKSRESFSQLIKSHPNDPSLLYNLGLVELKDNHPGRAAGYWRKALYLSPGFAPALDGMSQLEQLKFFNQNPPSFLLKIYWRWSIFSFFLTALLFLLIANYFAIRHIQQRKLKLHKSSPLRALLFFTAFIVILFFALDNYWTLHQSTQATIMVSAAPAHSAPAEDSPSLFEFKEGDSVHVRRENGDWIQVQKSSTALGWVKKDQIFAHSGIK